MPVRIIDSNKGKSSIQINGLQKILSSKPYNSLKTFAEAYSIEDPFSNDTLEQIHTLSKKLQEVLLNAFRDDIIYKLDDDQGEEAID